MAGLNTSRIGESFVSRKAPNSEQSYEKLRKRHGCDKFILNVVLTKLDEQNSKLPIKKVNKQTKLKHNSQLLKQISQTPNQKPQTLNQNIQASQRDAQILKKTIQTDQSDRYKKYRRQKCKTCQGCMDVDCQNCHYCNDSIKYGGTGVLKKKCIKRKCLKPLLPANASCNICQLTSTQHKGDEQRLMECGFCYEVVHPKCQIKLLQLPFDVEYKIYSMIPNAWDCLVCTNQENRENQPNIKPEINSKTICNENSLLPPTNNTSFVFDNNSMKQLKSSPISKKHDESVEKLSKLCSDDGELPICNICHENENEEHLMTCYTCHKVTHDVCLYVKHRDDDKIVPGIRNCIDPKFWQCPFCCAQRGLKTKDWEETGFFKGVDAPIYEKKVTKRWSSMFSQQTGSIKLLHLEITYESLNQNEKESYPEKLVVVTENQNDNGYTILTEKNSGPPEAVVEPYEAVECFMDSQDPELITLESADKNAMTADTISYRQILTGSLVCVLCQAAFVKTDLLIDHIRTQHPKCKHCDTDRFFLDIPKILQHLKTVHHELDKCMVSVGNQTLIIAK